MKNRQLMRLNKVSHNSTVKTVDSISPGYISFIEDIKNDDNFGNWVSLDDVEFIPLTEEILLKCGFEQESHGFKKGLLIFRYRLDCKFIPIISDQSLKEINHLHQLQNLYYALTGEELQINL